MQEVLLRKLIEKDYFKVSTEVDAFHKGSDLCGAPIHSFEGTFTVVKMLETRKDKRLRLELMSTEDGFRVQIEPSAITRIDGMTPERFAENYMIAPDGSDIKITGKRRGRRPKNWKANSEIEED